MQYSSSFLYGPPGTGKTTTLGVLLAEYLHLNPRARVLLLSTTNHAVDQATVAVDKALEQSKREALRKTIKRQSAEWAQQAVTETGMGNVDHKITKLKLIAAGTPGLSALTASARQPQGTAQPVTR